MFPAQSLLIELHSLQQRRHELDMASEGPSSSAAVGVPVGSGSTKSPPGASGAGSDWQRVEELYELCERWKAPAAVLPSVLERLKLLKGVHQEAGGMAVRLSGRSFAPGTVNRRQRRLGFPEAVTVSSSHGSQMSLCVTKPAVLEKQQEDLQAWVKRADDAVTQLQKTVLESIGWAKTTVAQMQQRLQAVEATAPADK